MVDKTVSTFVNIPLSASIPASTKDIASSAPAPSSSKVTSFSLEVISADKGVLEGVNSATQALSNIVSDVYSSINDPFKLCICDALVKLLYDSPPNKPTRTEIFSQIDPSVHIALDLLESRRRMVLDKGFSEFISTRLDLSRQKAALEEEFSKLKGKLQDVTLEFEDLCIKNRDLRGMFTSTLYFLLIT